MSLDSERLYELLPALHRVRDAERGAPLQALLSVVAAELARVERDMAGLAENAFVETCDEWVLPYVADLLGARGVHNLDRRFALNQRARVANTIGYRRRKGTPAMLEQLARDSSGWPARAVEYFALLAWNQHLNHVRPEAHGTLDLRSADRLELLDGPFDSAAHTVDVRRIEPRRGEHNIPNVGLHVWRLESYHVRGGTAPPAVTPSDGRHRFDPVGLEAGLFQRPRTETDPGHLAEEPDVPGRLRRLPLYFELEARRQALVDGREPRPVFFGEQPALRVFTRAAAGDPLLAIPPEELSICNLADPPTPLPEVWRRPLATKSYVPSDGGPALTRPIAAAVDPVLGRIAFPVGVVPDEVRVDFAYGFSGDVGAGPYDRARELDALLERDVDWHVGVSRSEPADGVRVFDTLGAALAAWKAQPAGTVGIVSVLDNATYAEDLTGAARIEVPEGSQLFLIAAAWPALPPAGGGAPVRRAGRIEPVGARPTLVGDVEVFGKAPAASLTPGELVLDGLLVDGRLSVSAAAPGNLGRLRIGHCTFVPARGGVKVNGKNDSLALHIERSIVGRLQMADTVPALHVVESLVHGEGGAAVQAPGTALTLEGATLFGEVQARELSASDVLFTSAVTVERAQVGCVRFSYVPAGSVTPRCYRCQPELALKDAPPGEEHAVRSRLVPSFVADTFGQAELGQLAANTAGELTTGAEDGSEMGAFRFLKQPQREANVRVGLEEYLRFGLEAGLLHAT